MSPTIINKEATILFAHEFEKSYIRRDRGLSFASTFIIFSCFHIGVKTLELVSHILHENWCGNLHGSVFTESVIIEVLLSFFFPLLHQMRRMFVKDYAACKHTCITLSNLISLSHQRLSCLKSGVSYSSTVSLTINQE